jgi:hypothetical protein
MIDATGSINSFEMDQQRNAVKVLLNFFKTATIKPRVSIGTFNVTTGPDARILASLTANYGQQSPATGLYHILNSSLPYYGEGWTDIGAALAVAKSELETNAPASTSRYILIVSDGITNYPSGNSPDQCSSGNPGLVAATSADVAESVGIDIIAVRFGNDFPCPVGTGSNFLKDVIATTQALFYEGNANLSGIFTQISQSIVCDDGDVCTRDSCVGTTCTSAPITGDADGDGVSDCQDKCPGANDNLIGLNCAVGIGACQGQGSKVCQCNGNNCQIVCNASAGDPSAEICNLIDDDCDGLVDEDLQTGQSCTVGVGQCLSTGQFICTPNGTSICSATPGTPQVEVCDNIDNDCDGITDEIFDSCGVRCGDGTSCLCTEVSYQSLVNTIDSNALAIFSYAQLLSKHALMAVKSGRGKPGLTFSAAKVIANNILAELSIVKNDSWQKSNVELVKISRECGSAFTCVSVNNISTLDTLYENVDISKSLNNSLTKQLGVKGDAKVKEIRAALAALYARSKNDIRAFPSEVSSCSIPN